jgi:hypothetical protein
MQKIPAAELHAFLPQRAFRTQGAALARKDKALAVADKVRGPPERPATAFTVSLPYLEIARLPQQPGVSSPDLEPFGAMIAAGTILRGARLFRRALLGNSRGAGASHRAVAMAVRRIGRLARGRPARLAASGARRRLVRLPVRRLSAADPPANVNSYAPPSPGIDRVAPAPLGSESVRQ